ncbi:hypothetical protein [Fundidesulfovibrio agrisoli]|uniref:hypothetical protein n=1 Tax=Fundidesulfovibrio agrisoli TaxID=2922717 RepID=UPI001FAD7578
MEKVLVKLAKQLNNYDEASLINLWEKYAEQVKRFEPSRRWEESVLILSMIQAVRFKNQLFNLHWSEGRAPGEVQPEKSLIEAVHQPGQAPQPHAPAKPKGRVLSFKHKEDAMSETVITRDESEDDGQ